MKEKALTVPYKTSLDDVVKLLLEEKSKGEHAYAIFNSYIYHFESRIKK